MDDTQRSTGINLLLSFLLGTCALLLARQSGIPWLWPAGICLLGANAFAIKVAFSSDRIFWKSALVAAWLGALILPGAFLLGVSALHQVEDYTLRYCAVLAWLVAAIVVPVCAPVLSPTLRSRARIPTLVAALFTSSLLVATAWLHNLSLAFHSGLFAVVLLLLFAKLWFPLPVWCVQVVNSLLVLGLGLPVADFIVRPSYQGQLRPEELRNYYSFAGAKKDPDAFRRWWRYYGEQWEQFSRDAIRAGPRLQPNVRTKLVASTVVINSRGFRGQEIAADKGNAYRIVALGESTTFGITLAPTDRPWPDVLETLIRTRLKLDRPVEVINAGVPAISLTENLERMARDILPLQPDMILSYHGVNGFHLLLKALPSMRGEPPPHYEPRPLKLLADAEYRWRLLAYNRRHHLHPSQRITEISDPLATDYARAYQQLITIAATNHLRLVLANYSMAVNRDSPPEVVEFYRTGTPAIAGHIVANAAHSQLIAGLTRQHPEVRFVDTQAELDGRYEHFIDSVHFTQEGRDKLAELFFTGIRKTLEEDCARTNLTNAPH